jgi:hypothetical protein
MRMSFLVGRGNRLRLMRRSLPVLVAVLAMTPVRSAETPKKGVAFWNADRSFSGFSRDIDRLDCSWYYNWRPEPDARAGEICAAFVPMVWNGSDVTDKTLCRLKAGGYDTLLTFNEPDGKDQANMTVEKALSYWPKLMRSGLRLGSPAPASVSQRKDWLGRFMAEADKRGYRVDFICLHWYGDITAPDAVDELKNFLETQYARYRRPIWLTEFSGSTGYWIEHENPPVTPAKNAAFIRKALPMLEALPFLERYAWFELKWTEEPWADVALVNPKTGKLTAAGKAYRDAKPRKP